MNRFNRLVIVLATLCCAAVFAALPASAQDAVYPAGLGGAANVRSGLYPGTDKGNCCWMGAHAELDVTVPSRADTLLLNVYLPRFASPQGGQSLRVRIAGSPPQERCCFGAGEHELAFSLPAKSRGRLRLTLSARSTFVPKALGLNQDPRHLSVLIRDIAFSNSATGERFDTGPLPWLPARAALALLGVAAIAILALTLARPIFGVVALVLTDPFLLSYDAHGTSVTLAKVALLAVAAGLAPRAAQIARMRGRKTLCALVAPQIVFAFTMLAASQHAVFHGAALRETLKALEYAATFVAAYVAYRLDPDEVAVRLALSAVTMLVAILALAQLAGGAPQSETIADHTVARIAGPLEGPNQLAGFLGIVVPAMLAFAVLRAPLMLERVAIAIGTAACLLTFSRGGVGALLLAIAVLLLVRYRPSYRSTLAGGVATLFTASLALAFGVFTGALHGRVQALFNSSGDDTFNGGLGSRIDLWHGAYALWRLHPLLGIGPGNFEYAIGKLDPGVRTHANGMYFQALAEQGLAGLIAMLAVVAVTIGAFIRRLNEPLALGACMAALAMAFHQIVDCMWLYPKVGGIWWVLLALGAASVDLRDKAQA